MSKPVRGVRGIHVHPVRSISEMMSEQLQVSDFILGISVGIAIGGVGMMMLLILSGVGG